MCLPSANVSSLSMRSGVGQLLRVAAEPLGFDPIVRPEANLRVTTEHRVGAAGIEGAVRSETSDVRVLSQVVPITRHRRDAAARIGCELGALLERDHHGRTFVARRERAQTRRRHATGQLGRKRRVVDRARVHGVDPRVVQVAAFLEERPTLREEQRKRRIDVDLSCVGLDLAEVGIDREVGRRAGRERVARRQLDVAVEAAVFELGAGIAVRS